MATVPKVFTVTVEPGDHWSANELDVVAEMGSASTFTQINNTAEYPVTCMLNGRDDAIITIGAGDVQVFNPGDLKITSLGFGMSVSGSTTAFVEVLVAV